MDGIEESLISIVRSTREMTLPHWGNVEVERYKTGWAHDAVTKIDTDIESFLNTKLAEIYPDIGFFGEEFGGDNGREKFWLCDPIDGTGHFIRGLPFCTTMLALIDRGQVTFSIVYDFVNDLLYHAQNGNGAYCNGDRISVSHHHLTESYLSYETHLDKPENMEKLIQLRKITPLVSTLSAGYEFAMIASGKLDGRVSFDPYGKDWDFAPGALLVAEAGGVVTNIGRTTYDYRNHNFLATNKEVFEDLTSGTDAIFPIS